MSAIQSDEWVSRHIGYPKNTTVHKTNSIKLYTIIY